MKSQKLLPAFGMAAVLCSSIVSVGNAQQPPGGNGPMPGMGPQPQMGPMDMALMGRMNMPQMMPGITKVGVKGVFTLTGSTLSKLDLITLKRIASVELLQIPPTTQPSEMGGMGGMPMMMPMQPSRPVMALTAEKTLVVIGNQFFSVDAATMKIVSKATLPLPAPGMPGMMPGMPGMTPGMQNMPMMPGGGPQQMPGLMPMMQGDPNQPMPGMMPGMPADPNQPMPGMMPMMQGDPNQPMPGMMPMMQGDPNQPMPGMMPGMQGGPPQQQQQMMMNMMMMRQGMQMPPSETSIEVQGTTAYVISGSVVVAVNVNNGKVTGTNLPAAPKPPVNKN